MKRTGSQLVIVVILVVSAWIVGRAQSAQVPMRVPGATATPPSFQLQVQSSEGRITVTCLKGCELGMWATYMDNPERQPVQHSSTLKTSQTYGFRGPYGLTLPIDGWVK